MESRVFLKKYRTILLNLNEGTIVNNLSKQLNSMLDSNAVTYIYFNMEKKRVYVGETKCFLSRHKQHLAEVSPKYDYRNFTHCLVIYSRLLNKSSILDLEYLILNYLIAESDISNFIFLNGNNGQSELNYKEKDEVLSEIFYPLWKNEFYELGLSKNKNLDELRESLLFKYSPFKQLSIEQKEIMSKIIEKYDQRYLIDASAGAGKSVLFTNIAFSLAEKYPDMKIGVVTTGNLLNQFNQIFKSVGLNNRLTVRTASKLIMDSINDGDSYDIILVDEAHKLKKYYPKGHPNSRKHLSNGENEIEHLEKLTKGLVLLFDPYQGIKPQNISVADFILLTDNYEKLSMRQQFRIGGDTDYSGEDYLKGILYALQLTEDDNFSKEVFKDEYFGIVDNVKELFDYVDEFNHCYCNTTNRVLAGYCREWVSKPDKKANSGKKYEDLPYDWEIEGIKKRWNSTYEDWVKKPNSEQEIGSIHAIQGYDLDYVGVIIGKDITVRNGKIVAIKENYKDIGGTPLKESFDIDELTDYILDIYYVLLTRGIKGCRVYFEDNKLKRLFMQRVGLKE